MEIYADKKLSSELTFFVGERKSEKSKVELLLINDEPFCCNGTPTLAFETKNRRIINDMMKMFHGVMSKENKLLVDDIV